MKKLMLLALLIVGCEEILESIKEGCTTATACNYDADAGKDDGSCVSPQGCNEWCAGDSLSVQGLDCAEICGGTNICGCTDNNALNYNNEVTFDDGSCVGTHIFGCMLDFACNYNSYATRDCSNKDAEVSGTDWIQNDDCCTFANEGCECSDPMGAVADNCGTCDIDATNDCIQDCNGAWGGSSELDNCGVCGGDGSSCVIDIDGNKYDIVQIGNQTWMAENLKVIRYKNGDEIPTGHSNSDWANLTIGAYSVYPADSSTTCYGNCTDIYGNLYNAYAVDDNRGICPTGWHIPNDAEWTILTDYLGGEDIAGGKMKKSGHEHWTYVFDETSAAATNESGFTGLPSGGRQGNNAGTDGDGVYVLIGNTGFFWSTTDFDSNQKWGRGLYYYQSSVERVYLQKGLGISIRCLKSAP